MPTMGYFTQTAFFLCLPVITLGSQHKEVPAVWTSAVVGGADAPAAEMYNESLPLIESQGVIIQHDLSRQTHYLSLELQQFIFELNGLDGKRNIVQRQAAGGLGGGAGPVDPATLPTQAPTVTTYVLDGTPMPYTQIFRPIPEQWPSPSTGSIGLGTHTGQVGIVRTNEARIENLRARQLGAVAAGVGAGGFLLW